MGTTPAGESHLLPVVYWWRAEHSEREMLVNASILVLVASPGAVPAPKGLVPKVPFVIHWDLMTITEEIHFHHFTDKRCGRLNSGPKDIDVLIPRI